MKRYPYNNIDWTDLKQVQDLCNAMGDNCIVIKHALRPNYNITHLSRPDRWDIPGVDLVCVPITEANLKIIEQLKERANERKRKLHSGWAKAARASRMAKHRR